MAATNLKAHGLHYVQDWLTAEVAYTQAKFGLDADDEHTRQFADGDDEWWQQQFDNYLHRAKVLGIDTPGGRQALAKFVSTAQGMLMSAVRLYGPLPKPGCSSGENFDNMKELY